MDAAPHRKRWEIIADTARAQMEARMAADPELEQWSVGPGPSLGASVYAARSERHAEGIHAARMSSLIRRRKRADENSPPAPHRANPYCPQCAGPYGTTDRADATNGFVACASCGNMWRSPEDYQQAARADAAYGLHRAEEEQRGYDAARLGPELLARNERMLEQAAARVQGRPAQQLGLGLTA